MSQSQFIINWEWREGVVAYVVKGQPNRKPYTSNPADAQRWKTKAAAERFLSRKDPTWASMCRIVELGQ